MCAGCDKGWKKQIKHLHLSSLLFNELQSCQQQKKVTKCQQQNKDNINQNIFLQIKVAWTPWNFPNQVLKEEEKKSLRENVNANRELNRKQHYWDGMKNKATSSDIKLKNDLNEWPCTWASKFRENKKFAIEHKAVNCFMKN